MHVESMRLRNFRCYGEQSTSIALEPDLTAFIGGNGTGKTAACLAFQRLFGISSDERTIRVDDFHVPVAQDSDVVPGSRELSIEVVLAFPELSDDQSDTSAVPDFFGRMATDEDGNMICRIVLEAVWSDDGTIDGSIETKVFCVATLEDDYDDDQIRVISPAERSRIQFVYVPASRDGSKQVSAFLRGRIWKAAKWSEEFRDLVREVANDVGVKFRQEAPTQTVETAFANRWQQLQGNGTHSKPRFQPLEPDIDQFLRGAELTFEPDPSSPARPARQLSDGQRSLLHLALTTATLDLERSIRTDQASGFDSIAAHLPSLTMVAVEEPENSLSPFYLSRIVSQLLELGSTPYVQTIFSSHSASALGRINPGSVRHFRQDLHTCESMVNPISMPTDDSEADTYVREAIRAHPELYFARFVVLAEGDSEHIVIPFLARSLGIDLDPSFIAMVPLGGRHTHHFWRLLRDLQIPHATLLDLDFGRAGGGPGRIRTALRNLQENGVNILDEVEDFDSVDDVSDETGLDDLATVRDTLRHHGIFFSALLDLDMLMLSSYWNAYTKLGPGQRGPDSTDAIKTVIGTGGTDLGKKYWNPDDETQRHKRQEEAKWYRYLFSNRSKPATHLTAINQLTADEVKNAIPLVLDQLIEFIRSEITI